jgi:hypothetical protein
LTDELSPYAQHLRARLGRKDRAWPGEFDRCLAEGRSALAALRVKGGDDRFALFVLTNYRWRQVVPPGPRKGRDTLVAQIDELLGGQSVWHRRMRQSVTWGAAAEELRRAKDGLLQSRPHDTSAFESTQTAWTAAGSRWASDHSYTCLWVLDWYFRQVRGLRRSRRRVLGDLLVPFGFLGRSTDPDVLVAQRLRRNPRLRKGHRFIRNSTLVHLIKMHHYEHGGAGAACGPVCKAWADVLFFKPPAKADRLTERALALEGKHQHDRAAECYRAALDQAEAALGRDHAYLAWILVRYWLALRHAGQHGQAARVKPRADAMWAKYGMGHLSE